MDENNETVEIDCEIHNMTSAAIQIKTSKIYCWIPISQVVNIENLEELIYPNDSTIEIPYWLAEKKGLI